MGILTHPMTKLAIRKELDLSLSPPGAPPPLSSLLPSKITETILLLSEVDDIVDEAITFFRANVFFKNFEVQSIGDKLLVYLTLYINVALKRLEGCRTLAEGTKAIISLGLEPVPVPGELGFPFPGLFCPAQSKKEAGALSLSLFSLGCDASEVSSLISL